MTIPAIFTMLSGWLVAAVVFGIGCVFRRSWTGMRDKLLAEQAKVVALEQCKNTLNVHLQSERIRAENLRNDRDNLYVALQFATEAPVLGESFRTVRPAVEHHA
jgi:hypothetical protein